MRTLGRCLCCYRTLAQGTYHKKCAQRLFDQPEAPVIDFTEEALLVLSKQYVNQRLALTGVQKKLSLGVLKDKTASAVTSRLTLVGVPGGRYILKPPHTDYPYMPEVEDLTMALSELCDIQTARHGLVMMKDGALAYVTQRFDRAYNKKIAIEDLCQLSSKQTHEKYRGSLEQAGKVIQRYSSNPGDDSLRFFELNVFCFLTGNADMHLKNFSLNTNDPNHVHLAPAFDLLSTRLLIPEHLNSEEMALPMNGKKNNLRRRDFDVFSERLGITPKVRDRVIHHFFSVHDKFQEKIKQSFLPQHLQEAYITLIAARLQRLGS